MEKVIPELWEHQNKCIEKLKDLPYGALIMEMGTGKTPVMINILRHKFNKDKMIRPTLVLGPPIIIKQWAQEIDKFSKIPQDKVLPLLGSGKKRLQDFRDKRAKMDGFICITNYESVLMDPMFNEFKTWLREGIIVCDESQRIKSSSAKRTKKVIQLADLCDYRYMLTGTPILNSPVDIFSQYRMLDRGKTFGSNFFIFRNTYMYDKNAGWQGQKRFPDWKPRPGAIEQIGKKIESTSFQANKADCLTLPPLVKVVVPVDLGKEQLKAYEEMRKFFITYVKENACVADLAVTKSLRMQQILTGFAQDDKGEANVFEDNPRLEALSDLLEDITPQEKCIVWTNFKRSYGMIGSVCDKLKIPYVLLTGEQTTNQKNESIAAFRSDPKIRVIIGNPQAGGSGVNLVEASTAIYYSRNYSLENQLQSEARNHRGGSEMHKKITHYDLVATGTLDEVIMKALEAKEDLGETILKWAKNSG